VATPTYEVGVEFVAGSYTNLSSYCLRVGVTRDRATIFDSLSPGRCDLLLDNNAGLFSPENAASPYAPNLKPNKRVRILAIHNVTTYQLFAGFVDAWAPDPELARRTARMQATDRVKDLARRRIDTSIAVDIAPSSLATDVLSAAGVAAADRSVDVLPPWDLIPFAWFREYEPVRALEDIARFGYSHLWVDGAGRVNLRTRYLDLGSSAVASYVNDFFGFGYTLSDDQVVNAIKVQGTPRRIASSVQTVAWLQEVPTISASSSVGFWLTYLDPDSLERDTPAQSVSVTRSADYILSTISGYLVPTDPFFGLFSFDRTATASASVTFFGTTAVATVFNGSSDQTYLNKFQVRGYSIQRQPDILRQSATASSQTLYGVRNLSLQSDFIGKFQHAQDYADFLVLQRKDPVPDVTFALKNVFPDVLARELGDLVYLVESNTAVGTGFVVTGLAHDIALVRGLEHTTTYAAHLQETGPWLVLDHATLGKLDSGRELAF